MISAAEAVVRAEGSAALSMRRVARELDSSPMALYRHVGDKDDLLRHLLDRVARQVERPARPAEPRERVLVVGRAVHAWLREHSWAIDVLPAHVMGWSAAWIVEDIVAALMAGGLPADRAMLGYHAIWQYIVGELTLVHAAAARDSGLTPVPSDDARRHDLPMLAALGQWPARDDTWAFDAGLGALVDGLLAA